MSKNKLLKITEDGKFDFSNIDLVKVHNMNPHELYDFLKELCTEAFLAGLDDAITIKESEG